MKSVASYLKDPSALWPTSIALLYIAVTYIGGWWLMSRPAWGLNALGVLACAHGMVIAAYLIHDCAHNALFDRVEHNSRLGKLLNWIAGGCYGTYEDLRYKHMRHHIVNADPLSFDYRGMLKRRPWLARVVFALEWAYVPAVELLMHAMLLLAPFHFPAKRAQRGRVLGVIAVRATLLLALLWWSPRAVALYALAYLLLLTVLRFMDSFQHNYELTLNLDDPKAVFPHKGDAVYEQSNTYTNLLSRRRPWLNLLVLNFCYHNAHHEKPTVAWHKLPALHRQLYAGTDEAQTIGFVSQLRSYHRMRLARIYSEDYGAVEVREALRHGNAVGANGLNFLTAF